ncbi:uncharacterized protein METZ01_LOCUS300473, partial [marine metagenome]
MPYSLIIPIFNEQSTLPQLLDDLKLVHQDAQIIIVNDGSTDETNTILKDESGIDVIVQDTNQGKGAAIQTGLEKVEKDFIIIMDGDLEVSVDDIPTLLQHFKNNNNPMAVIGVRWQGNQNRSLSINALGNKFLNSCFNFLFSTSFTDILCCFKAMPKDLIRSFELQSQGFGIETEIMANLASNNIPFQEINIHYNRRDRKQG